ncbi:MAG TPA: hypothetical protein VL463_29615 [Kofleriaceae bacterium]|jgi:hypothetical protein|nr:hypothetical protein [Kofleriaceae bacterium]
MLKTTLAAMILLVACGKSKTDDHAATASGSASGSGSASASAAKPADPPPPPPPTPPEATGQEVHGVKIVTKGDSTDVVDSVGGFRLTMPGKGNVETDTEGEAGVHVTIETDDAVMGFKIKRLPAEAVKGVDVKKVYGDMVSGLADVGFKVSQKEALEMGGQPAYHYTATKNQDGIEIEMQDWMIEVPKTATLYQIVITTEASKAPPADWVAATALFAPN